MVKARILVVLLLPLIAYTSFAVVGAVDDPTIAEPVAGGADTPTAGAETPTDGAETPIDGAEAPTDGAETPTGGAETPTGGAETPTGGGETPVTAEKLVCSSTNIYIPTANPDDPNSYYVCLSPLGNPIKKICPEGFIFSADTLSCKLAPSDDSTPTTTTNKKCYNEGENVSLNDAACTQWATCTLNDGSLSLGDPATCGTDQVFSPFAGVCVPNTEYTCGDDMPDCDVASMEGKRFVDIHDCKSFYMCSDGIRILEHCPTGYEFEPFAQICVPESKSHCSAAGGSVSTKDLCKGSAHKFVADPDYCRGYYYCVDEKTPFWDYCVDGKYFNNGYCTLNKPATCVCEDVEYPANKNKVYVQHSDNTKFYVCSKTDPAVVKSCPSGYKFDATELSCTK